MGAVGSAVALSIIGLPLAQYVPAWVATATLMFVLTAAISLALIGLVRPSRRGVILGALVAGVVGVTLGFLLLWFVGSGGPVPLEAVRARSPR
jgi:hypothetical protein